MGMSGFKGDLMDYNGEERRKETREFCPAHIGMTNDIVEIKTILINIEKGLTQGITFKTAMIGCMVLVVLTIISQAFLYGRLCERVERNTGILVDIQEDIRVLQQNGLR